MTKIDDSRPMSEYRSEEDLSSGDDTHSDVSASYRYENVLKALDELDGLDSSGSYLSEESSDQKADNNNDSVDDFSDSSGMNNGKYYSFFPSCCPGNNTLLISTSLNAKSI